MTKQARGWVAVALAFACLPMVQAATPVDDGKADTQADAEWRDAIALVQQRYLQQLTHEQVVERALKALLADLDPYSKYLTPQERAFFEDDLAASFGGVGVNLDFGHASGEPVVRFLMLDSPGGRAGVRRGDRIVRVDGHATKGASADAVIGWLRGDIGAQVRLDVAGADSDATRAIHVVRDAIHIPSVRGHRRDDAGTPHYMLDPASRIGYVRISAFADDTVATLSGALASLQRQRMRGLVLDLRDSIGGKMRAALDSADLFVDHGRLLTVVERDEVEPHDATPGRYTDVPIVVLVNGNTVSSAEIMVGALKDNGRAVLVGQRTFGKGRVQTFLKLGDGQGALVLSTGTFQRPSGKTIDRNDVPPGSTEAGIAPDPGMEVVVEGKEYEAWREHASLLDTGVVLSQAEQDAAAPDRALDRAIEVLRGMAK